MHPNPTTFRGITASWARVVLLLLCLTNTACMSLLRGTARGHDLAPNGMTRADDGFRRALIVGAYGGAFARARTPKSGAPDDPLLRALYRGLTGFYAGEHDASVDAFARADALVERRLTTSVSRAAASVITSDGVLPYLPTRTEALFLRYYAMHAYARAGRASDAVVEARRLGRALEDVSASLSPGERPLHATLRTAAGAVFEAAGERNDALVSYRNAALLRGADRQEVDSITLRVPGGDSATLIVFIESGFVAHRVDRGLAIGLGGERELTRDSAVGGPAPSNGSGVPAPAGPQRIAERALRLLDGLPGGGVFADGLSGAYGSSGRGSDRVDRPMRIGDAASSFVRVAWPALSRASNSLGAITLLLEAEGGSVSPRSLEHGADVTNALAEDVRRDRGRVLTRAVARAVAKGAVTDALRDKHGNWAGRLASLAGAAFERADTRSWHLLPGTLRVVRLTLPAGTHAPSLQVGTDVEAMTVTLPATTVAPGETRVLSTRIWRDGSAFTLPVADTRTGTGGNVDRRPDKP